MKGGVTATIRKEFGSDIDAACGQLKAKVEEENRDE
jgi:adenine C2-methylase RlmN of 23S rRNA A2503 and tRNA A37